MRRKKKMESKKKKKKVIEKNTLSFFWCRKKFNTFFSATFQNDQMRYV